ncbi:MAG: HesA/MoeB/ThiF family protein [Eubacteriales bacterium]
MSQTKDRYLKNMNLLSSEENEKLKDFRVCVVGCGGIGGYVIEFLARLGIGEITAIDGDVFDYSNLNRQLLSDEKSIGKSKSEAARDRVHDVNSEVVVNQIKCFLTEENCDQFIDKHHVVVDALDNMKTRKMLEEHCKKLSIPMVHGAIAGWYAQISTILPGDDILSKIYPEGVEKGIEVEIGNPSFTPALAASIEVSEVVKLLFNKGDLLSKKLLTINLLNCEFEIFDFN